MKHTILAVDDEPANLRMLERLLHREYRVLTASSGEEGLELLRREVVSLIISDQRMPGMTGTEMLQESLGTNPDAVKIILTGYTDVEALIEAINCARVYRYVNKPWDPERLAQSDRTVGDRRTGRYVRAKTAVRWIGLAGPITPRALYLECIIFK